MAQVESARMVTPEAVALEFPTANLGSRILAYLIDMLVVVARILAALFAGAPRAARGRRPGRPGTRQLRSPAGPGALRRHPRPERSRQRRVPGGADLPAAGAQPVARPRAALALQLANPL